MNIKYKEHYAKRVRPVIGAYYKYTQSLSDGRNKGMHQPRWRGARMVKQPTDIILYAEAIWANRPDIIIETGTRFGASAAFFGDMLSLSGGERVYSIDVKPEVKVPTLPNVTYITGNSTDPEVLGYLRRVVANKSVMITLDSDHSTENVTRELAAYHALATPGQYIVVEDCWAYDDKPWPPYSAVMDFLAKHPEFEHTHPEDKYIFGNTRDGWLLKKKS